MSTYHLYKNFGEKLPSNGTGNFFAPKTGTGLSCTIYKILVNFSLSLDMKPGTSNPDKWYRKITNPLSLTFFQKSFLMLYWPCILVGVIIMIIRVFIHSWVVTTYVWLYIRDNAIYLMASDILKAFCFNSR